MLIFIYGLVSRKYHNAIIMGRELGGSVMLLYERKIETRRIAQVV